MQTSLFYLSGHLLFAFILHHNFMFFLALLVVAIFYIDLKRKWSIRGPLQNPVGDKIRRHRLVSGVARREGRNWLDLELKDPTWIMSCTPGYPRRLDFSPKICLFSFSRPALCHHQTHQKNKACPNPSKSQKITPWTPKTSISIPSGRHLDHLFPSVFLTTKIS